ncbi:MAG TPA: heme exporter protein CcmD [Rhodospirillales bacterium]|jgi:heme exporter protein D|nr:heme exporter protein CcmD [Rhodospirillales bacterium]|tara:strand:- start:125 stop:307 length:183 start_codon:yes stop_codon:yes gene_type:complete
MEFLTAFFHMGGYGVYIWPGYALTIVVLVGILVASIRSLRSNEARLQALQAEIKAPSNEA